MRGEVRARGVGGGRAGSGGGQGSGWGRAGQGGARNAQERAQTVRPRGLDCSPSARHFETPARREARVENYGFSSDNSFTQQADSSQQPLEFPAEAPDVSERKSHPRLGRDPTADPQNP